LPAISRPRPTVRARAAGWLPEWLQSSFWNSAVSGACDCHCLARGPLFHHPRRLLLFVPSLQPPSPSLSLHLLCFLSQHTLWLIIAFTLLTAAHRSTQVAHFDAGGIAYLRTNILHRSKHPLPDFCAETSTNAGGNTRDSTSTNTARSSR
jgi:hypothetical protein